MSKARSWFAMPVLVSCAIILFPLIAHAQTFLYRKQITIDHTKVSAALSNFPVLVSISNDNDLRDHVMNANAYDLAFVDGNGSQLDHEVERWDGATGTLLAWVRVPSLSAATDTVMYAYYGNNVCTYLAWSHIAP